MANSNNASLSPLEKAIMSYVAASSVAKKGTEYKQTAPDEANKLFQPQHLNITYVLSNDK